MRKLYGATGRAIGGLLAREFGVLITVSVLFGLTVAYIATTRYLAEFVEHAPMGLSPLVVASLFVMLIAIVAVWRHTRIAMRILPAVAVRS